MNRNLDAKAFDQSEGVAPLATLPAQIMIPGRRQPLSLLQIVQQGGVIIAAAEAHPEIDLRLPPEFVADAKRTLARICDCIREHAMGRAKPVNNLGAEVYLLYEALLTIHCAADLQWPEEDLAAEDIREKFQLHVFPPAIHASPLMARRL